MLVVIDTVCMEIHMCIRKLIRVDDLGKDMGVHPTLIPTSS